MASVILPNYTHNAATFKRLTRWLRYMRLYIKDRLEYDRIILLDNVSDLKYLKKINATVHSETGECLHVGSSDIFVYRFNKHYKRTGHLEYPYYWRSLYMIPKFIKTFYEADKYYWIDSDVYIVKQEFIDHIKNQNTGFIRYKDRKYDWGESILMTINKDSFYMLTNHERDNGGWLNRTDCAERTLPYTLIDDKYYGGRFPEANKIQDDSMYYIGQVDEAHPRYKVKWNNGK